MLIRTVAFRGVLTAVGVVAAMSLSGCVSPGTDPVPSSTPSPSVTSASPTPTDLPSPSNTAPPVETPTPVSLACDSVVDAQTMYDFNPNYGLLTNFSADAGSLTARAVADKGIACRWLNQTSGVTIDIGISKPGPTALSAARTAAESGTPISGLADAAYFAASGGTGLIQVFEGASWITVMSASFSSATDAQDIVNSAVAAAR